MRLYSRPMIQVDRDGAIATTLLSRASACNALFVTGWRAMAQAAHIIAVSVARMIALRSDEPLAPRSMRRERRRLDYT